MKAFVAILLLAFAKKSFAATGEIACANCEYSNGLGFVADADNCHVFHRCVKKGNGDVKEVALCCPNGTVWDQDHLACLFGYCASPYPFDVCPPDVEYENGTCPFEATGDPKKFKDKLTGKYLYCADATVFDEEACTCVLGGERTCSPDPLMHFPFAYDYNDVMCHKVQGTRHGDAYLNLTGGYVKLDGDGDYVSFSFLENWFAWRKTKDFLVSVWFRQSEDGWFNINNFPIEGMFGNGDCQQDASIWLTMGNETQQGGIRTDSDQAVFDNYGIDRIARDYFSPLVWCQVAIRYTETEVTLFLNGGITGKRSISGTLANTWAASTIGLTYFDCVPYFWTGCLDDLIIFDRYVGDLEASALFQLGRSEGSDNAPWSDHYP